MRKQRTMQQLIYTKNCTFSSRRTLQNKLWAASLELCAANLSVSTYQFACKNAALTYLHIGINAFRRDHM